MMINQKDALHKTMTKKTFLNKILKHNLIFMMKSRIKRIMIDIFQIYCKLKLNILLYLTKIFLREIKVCINMQRL